MLSIVSKLLMNGERVDCVCMPPIYTSKIGFIIMTIRVIKYGRMGLRLLRSRGRKEIQFTTNKEEMLCIGLLSLQRRYGRH